MLKSSHHQQLLAHSHNSNSSTSSSFGVVNGSSNLNNAHHYNNLNEKCTYCLNALASVAIRCAECPNFTLCLKCFSMSAEIGDHKKDHNYFLKTTTHFPVFDSEKCWSYKEELLLLQFIEQYGFGNWEDISRHLHTRSPQECMEHYHSYYIHGNLGKNTFNQGNKSNVRFGNSFVIGHGGQMSPALEQSCDNMSSLSLNHSHNHHHNHHNHHHHHHGRGKSMISNGSTKDSKSSAASAQQQQPTTHTSSSNSPPLHTTVQLPPIDMSIEEQRALGYMPLRDDFEREFKNHAETLLSTLSVANNQVAFFATTHRDSTAHTPTSGNNLPASTTTTTTSTANSTNLSNQSTTSGSELNEDFVDYQLKLTLIKMYREVLVERQKMKKIAREYGLINNASALINNYNNSLSTSSTAVASSCFTPVAREFGGGKKKRGPQANANSRKEPSDVINEKYKKYAQFMSASNYETLVESLNKLTKLNTRLDELAFYRSSLGLRRFDEVVTYRREKHERDERISMKKKRGPRRNSKRHLMLTASVAQTPKRLTRNAAYLSRSECFDSTATPSKRFKSEPVEKSSDEEEDEEEDEDEDEDEEDEDEDEEEEESVENEEMLSGEEDEDENEEEEDDEEEEEEEDEDEEEVESSSTSNDLYQEGSELGQNEENEEEEDEEEEDEEEDDEDEEEEEEEEEEENDEEKMDNSMMSRLRRLTSRSWSVSSDSNKNHTGVTGGGGGGVVSSSTSLSVAAAKNILKKRRRPVLRVNKKLVNGTGTTRSILSGDSTTGTMTTTTTTAASKLMKMKTRGKMMKMKRRRKGKKNNDEDVDENDDDDDGDENSGMMMMTCRNGRTERLCSMPGYNLLSENEKKLISSISMKPNDYINLKTILVNNSVAYRKSMASSNQNHHHPHHHHNQSVSSAHNQSLMNASTAVNTSTNSTTSSSTSTLYSSSNSTTSSPNNQSTHHQPQKIMTLRRTSASSYADVDQSATSAAANTTGDPTAGAQSTTTCNGSNNKFIMDMLLVSFPDYFKMPRSTRKRILRFLCDNGWIDVA